MEAMVLPTLLLVANVMGGGMIVPQVLRLHRARATDGLSAPWVGVGITMNLWWLAYAVARGVWGIAPVSVAGAVLYSIIAVQALAIDGRCRVRPLISGAAGAALVPLPALVISGWEAAGLAIGLAYGIQFAPAAISAVRSIEVTGLSPITWWMAAAEAAIWFIYGLAVSDHALTVGGAGGTLMAAIVLARINGWVGPVPAWRQPRLRLRRA